MYGSPTLLAQLPAVKGPKQKRARNLWKSSVAERVLENMRRQFPAMKVNAIVKVIDHYHYLEYL